MFNTDNFDKMIKAEARRYNKNGAMSANEWRFNDYGSAEPRSSTFDAIFSAYRDYKNSQQWG